jgi:tetratricopeptide (TPR) repeat protein
MRELKRQVGLGNLHKACRDAISPFLKIRHCGALGAPRCGTVRAIVAFGFTLLAVTTATIASAQEPKPASGQKEAYSPSHTVIVTDRAAPIMASEKTLASVPAGTILSYTKEEGNWLLVPRFNGWLKRDNALPIERGEEHYSNLIKTQPTAAAYHHRGNVRLAIGKLAEAVSDFTETARLEPMSTSPLVNRGIAKTGVGDLAGARADFDRALEIAPADPFALLHRALLSLDENNLAATKADVDKLLQVEPGSFEGLNCRGLIHLREKKDEQAIADFSKAIEIFPQFAGAYLNRGTAYAARAQYEDALKDYASAQQFDPNNIEAFNDAAWLLSTCPVEQVRNPKLAIQLAEQAKTLSPIPDGNLLDTLAAAYAADGQYEQAVKTLEEALKLLPESQRGAPAARLEKYRRKEPHVESSSPAT